MILFFSFLIYTVPLHFMCARELHAHINYEHCWRKKTLHFILNTFCTVCKLILVNNMHFSLYHRKIDSTDVLERESQNAGSFICKASTHRGEYFPDRITASLHKSLLYTVTSPALLMGLITSLHSGLYFCLTSLDKKYICSGMSPFSLPLQSLSCSYP